MSKIKAIAVWFFVVCAVLGAGTTADAVAVSVVPAPVPSASFEGKQDCLHLSSGTLTIERDGAVGNFTYSLNGQTVVIVGDTASFRNEVSLESLAIFTPAGNAFRVTSWTYYHDECVQVSESSVSPSPASPYPATPVPVTPLPVYTVVTSTLPIETPVVEPDQGMVLPETGAENWALIVGGAVLIVAGTKLRRISKAR